MNNHGGPRAEPEDEPEAEAADAARATPPGEERPEPETGDEARNKGVDNRGDEAGDETTVEVPDPDPTVEARAPTPRGDPTVELRGPERPREPAPGAALPAAPGPTPGRTPGPTPELTSEREAGAGPGDPTVVDLTAAEASAPGAPDLTVEAPAPAVPAATAVPPAAAAPPAAAVPPAAAAPPAAVAAPGPPYVPPPDAPRAVEPVPYGNVVPAGRAGRGGDVDDRDEDDDDEEDVDEWAKARRRHRRQSLTFAGSLAFVLVVGLLAYLTFLGRIPWPFGGKVNTAVSLCTPSKPLSPKTVTLRVYNGSNRKGLATAVTRQLQAFGFVVEDTGNDPLEAKLKAPIEVRHGDTGALAARTAAAYLVGKVNDVLDDRQSASVDVVLGQAFTRVKTRKEVAAALAALSASLPPTCPAGVTDGGTPGASGTPTGTPRPTAKRTSSPSGRPSAATSKK